jgi:hypothetical protein
MIHEINITTNRIVILDLNQENVIIKDRYRAGRADSPIELLEPFELFS